MYENTCGSCNKPLNSDCGMWIARTFVFCCKECATKFLAKPGHLAVIKQYMEAYDIDREPLVEEILDSGAITA